MKTKPLFAILLATGLAGCQDAPLEPALEQAGDNRKELEAVLEHYADEPLKEQAARFLIEHMDAQYAFGGEAVEQYGNCMDSLFRHCNGDRVFWIMKYDTLLQRIGTELSLCQQQKQPDTQTLTAGFLTEQIDSAFTLWQQNWTRQYSFDTFCRYVLPYRVGHERTGNWRRTFVTPVGIRAEYRTAAPNTTYAYGIANNILGSMRSEIYYPPQFLPDLPLEALAHVKSASCKEYAHLCVTLLRAHGLAATVDFTPQWGNRSMGHEWCVFFPDDHTAIPFNPGERLGDHFMKRKEDRLPKVFRTTYEKRPESLCMQNNGREAIPEVFDTPCLIDVTWEYTQTADIEVPLYGGLPHSRYAYLAVFDNQDWSIVHWGERKGGRASFADMACGIVYLPVLYSDEYGVQPAGDAFLLDTAGTVRPLVADTARRRTVRVKRKFRDTRSNQFLQAVVGGKFQVANKEDFSDSLTLHVIPRLEDNKYHLVSPRCLGRYKYFRYLSPDWSRGNMAELYTFNAAGDTLKPKRLMGNFHVRPWCGPENLFDGNVLSFYDSHDVFGVWYGWELEQPDTIARILFLPRNDDNFIRENEEYELFYWHRGTWLSLGRQWGNFEAVLEYGNAPDGALFRLHNRTKGYEERIFTYEQGKQIWW